MPISHFSTLGGTSPLFSFTDKAFSGGVLEATLGAGYVGGKNLNLADQLDDRDFFGRSVSLEGTRLAVGAPFDAGEGNSGTTSGAVYLFSFTDAAFSGGALEATLGEGYVGGTNLDLAAPLDGGDRFGTSVSLDGTRQAVGADGDNGRGNGGSNNGAVYLFSFTDTVFSGGVLEAMLGASYVGGKNLDLAAQLDDSDLFGSSVSLDGTRLAVGAFGDDGQGNGGNANGAVYLFSFTDMAFSGGVLEATIGEGYVGAKNLDLAARLENLDQIGYSVSLDGTRLAVGAPFEDSQANVGINSNYSAVYLFSFTDTAFSGGVLEATLGEGYVGGKNLDLAAQLERSNLS